MSRAGGGRSWAPGLSEDDLEVGTHSVSVPKGQSVTVTTCHHRHSPSSLTVAAGASVCAAQVASMIYVPYPSALCSQAHSLPPAGSHWELKTPLKTNSCNLLCQELFPSS